MNYKKIYDSLILNRKENILTDGLKELHHIIPRCLYGDNSKDNLVYLTPREHFICHWLLVKIYKDDLIIKAKMMFALNAMSRKKKTRYFNSRAYLSLRELPKLVKNYTSKFGKDNSNYGYKWLKFEPSEIQMKIPISEIVEYLDQGWVLGRKIGFNNVSKLRKKILRDVQIKTKKETNWLNNTNKYLKIYNDWSNSNLDFLNFCKLNKYNRVNLMNKFKRYKIV